MVLTYPIVNLGGQIWCEAMDCLEICTACKSVPSGSPTASPLATLHPTPQPKLPTHAESKSSILLMVAAGGLSGALVLAVVVAVDRRRRYARRASGRTLFEPLLGQADQDAPAPILPQSVELVGCSVMNSYELSPAPIFVVGRNSLCVAKWSPGMKIVAPMQDSPVGLPVADLPFVNPSDGHRFDRNLRRIFEAPAEHDKTQTFMLYLWTRNGRVLLETRADHLVTETEAIVVFTGREVDSDLACMMARESAVAVSESNYDTNAKYSGTDGEWLRSVSEVGSIKGDDIRADDKGIIRGDDARIGSDGTIDVCCDEAGGGASAVSSLTMPTFSAPSKGSDSVVNSSVGELSSHSSSLDRYVSKVLLQYGAQQDQQQSTKPRQ